MTTTTSAWGTPAVDAPLERMTIERRDVGATDVAIDVLYCGICHSDVHTARNEWGGTRYPAVPGHEIVGRVSAVGADVTRFAVGDVVGVGCMVDSCGVCASCLDGLQNYCENGATFTYNSVDKHGTTPRTYGGYSARLVVTEGFVVRVPSSLDPAAAAPILCAGITMYSPLRHHGVQPGTKLGVAGFGGLGSMAVKLAAAMGAEVTVLTRTDRKAEDALKAGADAVLVMSDAAAVRAAARSLDLILSTIPVTHDLNPYLQLLRRDGAYVILGAIEPLRDPINGGALAGRRLTVTGSMIGGIPETQEVLDFCAEHGIASDIALIGVDGINEAYDQLAAGDPGYRYVIDLSTI
ncbi:MAG TPA: NAD(P)-dependent alcohol dehydrogenase [Jatrophihabitantaceae bacterium]|nr:NAD(P)-dependent alcohol dehydrogenase [Jatrophihabitantaceae bacterium]